jgi:hypothetical protein
MRIALLAGLTLISTPAVAAPPPRDPLTEVERAVTLPDRQRAARAALESLGFDLGGDRPTYGPRGRLDVTLFTSAPREAVVEALKAAYRSSRALPHDVEVTGYAHLARSETHAFSVRVGTYGTTVIEVGAGPSGTEVVLWGLVRPRVEVLAPEPLKR